MSGSTEGRGVLLLKLAREVLEENLLEEGVSYAPPEETWLYEDGATFVTLKLAGKLRGCIGSIEPQRAIVDDVRRNAVAAAFRDPRFPALTAKELQRVQIEVSLLSPVEPLAAASQEELLACLRPGTDGVVLNCGPRRSTFLPQVWKQLKTPAEFLLGLKRKAGLDTEFWSSDLEFGRYTVEKWAEA